MTFLDGVSIVTLSLAIVGFLNLCSFLIWSIWIERAINNPSWKYIKNKKKRNRLKRKRRKVLIWSGIFFVFGAINGSISVYSSHYQATRLAVSDKQAIGSGYDTVLELEEAFKKIAIDSSNEATNQQISRSAKNLTHFAMKQASSKMNLTSQMQVNSYYRSLYRLSESILSQELYLANQKEVSQVILEDIYSIKEKQTQVLKIFQIEINTKNGKNNSSKKD